ncbi:MAG TPA: hypothetical protein VL913_00470 [Candidatus Micrarchaeaceae archaeon]|nr:hypothetical protein [Candidatus Micrarchaeaceae archaeon]
MDFSESTIYALAITWAIVTVALICLLIYRSTLSSHEDDQLFLDSAEESLANEQRALVARIDRLSRPITLLIVASSALLVVTAGIWLYEGFKNF